jgi:nitroimidazol reductase NimA-like FMN-containing flavoprotein (pyridoxamine 5'-phosphate oxidase superfamily)
MTPATARSRIRRHPERSVPDEASAILAAARVAHVGFGVEGQPFVLPMSYHYDEALERVYLHGARASRLLRHLAEGAEVCVTVTLEDGLVFSKSAKYHSMNYRSVVLFGRARAVEDDAAKRRVLEAMTRRYFPGRTLGRDYADASRGEIRGTALLEVEIAERSAKARRGGPAGPLDDDDGAPGTCGVIAL